jgi:hypothetical protein
VAGVPVKVIEDVPPLLENTGLYAVGVGSVAGAPEGPCGPVAPVGPGCPAVKTVLITALCVVSGIIFIVVIGHFL